ncbi:DUF664 domain-containing protein [Ornithinimicrobium flavum]|uniref:mycothiol transferase n=1 Tax=Ornithinimicrobium flavum TaxID=1288636 RepID=UPI001930EA80|nr:DUF664 domain-containing protein [Ornithinimicrobium flavum]
MDEDVLGRFCLAKLDEIIDVVAGMDDVTANRVPELPGANSAYQILTHCLGMVSEWTRQELLGQPVRRDREAEFVASGPVAELVARARVAREELRGDLARIGPGGPVRGRRGEGRFWGGSAEGVLLHVLEELCQHLGHLEITRDLVVAPADAGRSSARGEDAPFRVRAGAGSLRGEEGVVLPHGWTEQGVVVGPAANGAQLLHLSVALCVLNDVYREARRAGLAVDGVSVVVDGDFDDRWRSTGVEYAVTLDSPAPTTDQARLLDAVDEVAEIPRVLRAGVAVTRVR